MSGTCFGSWGLARIARGALGQSGKMDLHNHQSWYVLNLYLSNHTLNHMLVEYLSVDDIKAQAALQHSTYEWGAN